MFITAFMPYIEITIAVILKQIYRCWDRGSLGSVNARKPTKKTTDQQFIDLYSGSEYLIHFKYSTVIMQVYVAFDYGLFVPMLFILATIGIFNMYIVESFCMFYYYQTPPSYDEKLSYHALKFV